MTTVSLSLWLPTSRANFYSFTEDDWLGLEARGSEARCVSLRLGRTDYVPLMLVSVLRRLLEVLPRSFGYSPVGRCALRGDSGSRQRPVNLTMDLNLTVNGDAPDNFWVVANQSLVDAGATAVSLFVDENGAYCFTATCAFGADHDLVRAALLHHIREVFGGDYVVHPIPARRTHRVDPGSASLKAYNGLRDNERADRDPDRDEDDIVVTQPRGALSFAQLNILAEGLWNDMLSPAFYLEQREFIEKYFSSDESGDFLRSIADVIAALSTDTDARTTMGQMVVLHQFLTITSNGSLLKLKSALESVRRRLLDEMMGSQHRQSRLVQLRFTANGRERRPELAVSATESQLKGYARLVAAKFPLIRGVYEMTRLAEDHLDWVINRNGPVVLGPGEDLDKLKVQLTRIDGQVRHWKVLIADLSANVESLAKTIEHAWMDELLYEQKQARSEQEAMAEIERSRLSRPIGNRPGQATYNLVMLLIAIVAAVFTVNASDLSTLGQPGTNWFDAILLLKPVWIVVLVAYGLFPLGGYLVRASREKRGRQASYPYEFSFRLDESVDPVKLKNHVGVSKRRKLPTRSLGKRVWAIDRGYGRIERVSMDSTIVKVHTAVAFRLRPLRYARFEVISEILIHKIARKTQHVLVQCRAFGESPRPLTELQLIELLKVILRDLLDQLAETSGPDDRLDVDALISESLYGLPISATVVAVSLPEPENADEPDSDHRSAQPALTR